MYVLAPDDRASSSAPLRVIFDAYVSIGNNGIGKRKEGDGKTPIGVYFTQKHLTEPMLPDLYGSGALTLDYPSPIDKLQMRTGSGIWLHGSPSLQYARPPTATDGCVVLANDDMTRLVQLGIAQDTPVIIAEKINWIPAKDFSGSELTVLHREAPQPLPGKHFEPIKAKSSTLPEMALIPPAPDAVMVSAFEWTDPQQQQVAIVTYERSTPKASVQRSHTYWVKQNNQWKEITRNLKL